MEHSPCEVNSFSVSQQIPNILWHPQVHDRVHKKQPFVPILSEINPLPALPVYRFMVPFNIILPSLPV
jgi:hypothetical protein